MLSPTSTVKESSSPVPRVLLQAKKEVSTQEKTSSQAAWNNGPWDKGHWANRK